MKPRCQIVSRGLLVVLVGGTLALAGGCGGGDTGQEIIIDNRDAGFAILSGDWGVAGSDNGNGSYGPDFRYHFADQVNVGRARFTPQVSERGEYEVSIYWSAGRDRTTDQPVIVHDAEGTDHTYYVNLQEHGNQWFPLGRHVFAPGAAGGYIEFNTDTADGYCNADAVRLVRVTA